MSILVTVGAMVTEVSEEQPLKVYCEMVCKLFGILMDARFVHPLKAYPLPKELTDEGKVILVTPVHP